MGGRGGMRSRRSWNDGRGSGEMAAGAPFGPAAASADPLGMNGFGAAGVITDLATVWAARRAWRGRPWWRRSRRRWRTRRGGGPGVAEEAAGVAAVVFGCWTWWQGRPQCTAARAVQRAVRGLRHRRRTQTQIHRLGIPRRHQLGRLNAAPYSLNGLTAPKPSSGSGQVGQTLVDRCAFLS